jgi:hypothetical protein
MYIICIHVVSEMIVNDEHDILNAPVHIMPIHNTVHIFQTMLILIW